MQANATETWILPTVNLNWLFVNDDETDWVEVWTKKLKIQLIELIIIVAMAKDPSHWVFKFPTKTVSIVDAIGSRRDYKIEGNEKKSKDFISHFKLKLTAIY